MDATNSAQLELELVDLPGRSSYTVLGLEVSRHPHLFWWTLTRFVRLLNLIRSDDSFCFDTDDEFDEDALRQIELGD